MKERTTVKHKQNNNTYNMNAQNTKIRKNILVTKNTKIKQQASQKRTINNTNDTKGAIAPKIKKKERTTKEIQRTTMENENEQTTNNKSESKATNENTNKNNNSMTEQIKRTCKNNDKQKQKAHIRT